jgi:hypothetical protein
MTKLDFPAPPSELGLHHPKIDFASKLKAEQTQQPNHMTHLTEKGAGAVNFGVFKFKYMKRSGSRVQFR